MYLCVWIGYGSLTSSSFSGLKPPHHATRLQEKIRLYEKIDRAPLRKFDKSWYEAVAKYAKASLGLPRVFPWLSHAMPCLDPLFALHFLCDFKGDRCFFLMFHRGDGHP